MGVPQLYGINGIVQILLFRRLKGVGDPQIIRFHPQKAGNQGSVSTVAKSGIGE